MNNLYLAERSPIQSTGLFYQAFGEGKQFLAGGGDEQQYVQKCALIDLTNLSRVGFRGQDAAAYLVAQGFNLPSSPNHLSVQQNGSIVARLSATEYFLIGSLKDFGHSVAQLEASWQQDESHNYLLARQDSHAFFQLTGAYNTEIMAKLCGVDLSNEIFQPGMVVQTSVARINAIIMNVSDGVTTKFNLLCDRTSSLYLWEVLLDAMAEFNGKPIGIEALIP